MPDSLERSSRLILVFAGLGHAWFHVMVALFLTVVLVLEPEWGLPYDRLIALWTFGALMLGLGAPAAGWLSDRWGETRVMILFLLGMGGALVVCGLAGGPFSLELALGAVGLFGAIYHPVGTAWVVKNARARGKAIAVVGLCGGVGAALASLIAGGLTDLLSWRAAFMIPGGLSILLGLALLWLFLSGAVIDRQRDALAQAEPTRGEVKRAFAVLALTMSLTTVVYYAFTTMLPKWLDRAVGAHLGEGLIGLGALVTAVYLLGTTAQIVGGHLSDRGAAKGVYVASYGLKFAALALAAAVTGWPVIAAAVAIVFLFDIAAPVENVLIARFTPRARRGLAYGIRNGIAILAAPLGVSLVSWLFQPGTGFARLLLVLAALVLVIFLAAWYLPGERAESGTATT